MRLVLVALLALFTSQALAQPVGSEQRSPFTDISFDGDEAHIEIDGEMYVWRGIDGIEYAELRAFAENLAGELWQVRLGEDLDWVLIEHGTPAGETVEMLVSPIGGGEVQTLEAVPMTRKNRQLFKGRQIMALMERAQQIRDGKVDVRVAFDELAKAITEHHAYASLQVDDLDALIEAEIGSLGAQDDWSSVVLAAQRVICRLGDGHARADDWDDALPEGYLPVLLQHASGGVVAFKKDRSGFVDPARPYVTAIDGLPIEDWTAAASAYVTDGSPQLIRRRSLRLLRWIIFVREELDLPYSDSVTLTLTDGNGDETNVKLFVASRRPTYGDWPRTQTGVLDSGIGYLRLSQMTPSDELEDRADDEDWEDEQLMSAWADELHNEIDSLGGAPAIIIDVRGNGGGLRHPTIALMKRIMAADSEPVVVNAARARLIPRMNRTPEESHLENRMLYPESWQGWTEAERRAIAKFKKQFTPEWTPSDEDFGDWHYMVVSPDKSSPQEPRPVVVLIDAGCFSATDIFAAALGELPNVTLLGQPTSGGSARSQRHSIEALGIDVRLASMVSYQPGGKLYDTNGVAPDIAIEPKPGDLIGETDSVLEHAEAVLIDQTR